MMNVKIRSFGQLTEITGTAELQMQAEDSDLLRILLVDTFPELAGRNFAMAINKQLVRGNTPLEEQDVVALLPPFSGG
jgi:molybdopterin synthase sulfur carrier subunit